MTARVAVPSRGRLRDDVMALLDRAGYSTSKFRGASARVTIDDIEFIEMRPRDAAAWLAAGRVEGAFISTDIVLEERLEELATIPLGVALSELVVASRDDDGRTSVDELAGAVIATHMPRVTTAWFEARGVTTTVVTMGGALEGVCAAGMADAIVDLRETGTSLSQNRPPGTGNDHKLPGPVRPARQRRPRRHGPPARGGAGRPPAAICDVPPTAGRAGQARLDLPRPSRPDGPAAGRARRPCGRAFGS